MDFDMVFGQLLRMCTNNQLQTFRISTRFELRYLHLESVNLIHLFWNNLNFDWILHEKGEKSRLEISLRYEIRFQPRAHPQLAAPRAARYRR